jgi:hypothetical protein
MWSAEEFPLIQMYGLSLQVWQDGQFTKETWQHINTHPQATRASPSPWLCIDEIRKRLCYWQQWM